MIDDVEVNWTSMAWRTIGHRKTTTVEDFAKACVFFAAEASDAVTGQSLSVDGGLTMP